MYYLVERQRLPNNPRCSELVRRRFAVAEQAIEAGWAMQSEGDERPFDVHTSAGTIYWAWEGREAFPWEERP